LEIGQSTLRKMNTINCWVSGKDTVFPARSTTPPKLNSAAFVEKLAANMAKKKSKLAICKKALQLSFAAEFTAKT